MQAEEHKIPTTIIKNAKEITSPKEITDIMAKGFIEKVNNIREKIDGNRYEAINIYKKLVPWNENSWTLKTVTIPEVYLVITNMKKSNSRGNDNLTARIIKEMPSFIATTVCHLFNCMVRCVKFPEALKIARLTPILKPGKVDMDIELYRPIANLNVIEKVVEELFKKQLEKFFKEYNVITPKHHSSRKGHSTATAKATLDMNITSTREKQLAAGVITTDLSAAYDTVDSNLLLNKLEHVGVRFKELELVRTYLTSRKAYIEIQGFFSELMDQPDCSVIQGSKLSTTFYTVYTLDITEVNELINDPEEF